MKVCPGGKKPVSGPSKASERYFGRWFIPFLKFAKNKTPGVENKNCSNRRVHHFPFCLLPGLLIVFLMLSSLAPFARAQGCGQIQSGKFPWFTARALRADQIKTQNQILALCDLAKKAAPVFPRLALDLARQALSLECSQEKARAVSLVGDVRRLFAKRLGADQEKMLQGLESRARAAWRFRLIGQTAQALQPEFSLIAYDFALRTCLTNPDVRQRDAELVELAAVLARHNRWKAWVLIRLIKEKTAKVRAMRLVASAGNSWFEMGCALVLAQTMEDPASRIKALSGIAKSAVMWNKSLRTELCTRAFDLAKEINDKSLRAWLEGRVAADAALIDPHEGLALAMAMGSRDGTAFEAFFQAAVGLEVLNAVQASRAWLLAWDQVGYLGGEPEKALALGRIVRAVSGVDPKFASEVLQSWPRGEFLVRTEAEAALALSMAGNDLAGAIAMAGRIRDQVVRLRTLARLAGASSYELQKAGQERLPEKVLMESGNLGESETALLLIPSVAAISPARAVGLIQKINEPLNRAKGLIRLARILWHQGRDREAVSALNMALWEINCTKNQQTLDNVRILGDMGRGWALIDPGKAKKVFLLGVQAAYR